MELLESGRRVGYLLKSRVTDVEDFVQTVLARRRNGARRSSTPALVRELVSARAARRSPAGADGARAGGPRPDGGGLLERRASHAGCG
jgi:hypothetical protein